ncbi:conserved hypothetical protein [Haloferula helveola]|uniref:DUF3127 domain-containing protein n=1 Tax=Haloferula helveola TaxID=490095 RepID=A0ABM7RI80_9BACT|nr:conserved hypothetical protein [Haloferula helveola]
MANSFELEGTVRHLFDLQTFNSGFTKREFVVEIEDGKYPQMVKFECVKDKTSILDDVSVGDRVQVTFDIRGNEYKDRFYVNLVAWKLGKSAGGDDAPAPGSSMDASFDNEPDQSDDIPF